MLISLVAQELGNDTKVCFLKIFETWEFLIEILSQIQNFLRDFKNFILSLMTYLNQFGDNSRVDEIFSLQLLAYLEGNIDCTNS